MYVIESPNDNKYAIHVSDIVSVSFTASEGTCYHHAIRGAIKSNEPFDQAVARLTLARGGEHWVDCNNRYPPSGQLVLVTDGCKEFETAWYDGGSGGTVGAWKNTQGQFLPWFRPVAWMPLPMRYVKP